MFDFVIPINAINSAEGLHDAFDIMIYTIPIVQQYDPVSDTCLVLRVLAVFVLSMMLSGQLI